MENEIYKIQSKIHEQNEDVYRFIDGARRLSGSSNQIGRIWEKISVLNRSIARNIMDKNIVKSRMREIKTFISKIRNISPELFNAIMMGGNKKNREMNDILKKECVNMSNKINKTIDSFMDGKLENGEVKEEIINRAKERAINSIKEGNDPESVVRSTVRYANVRMEEELKEKRIKKIKEINAKKKKNLESLNDKNRDIANNLIKIDLEFKKINKYIERNQYIKKDIYEIQEILKSFKVMNIKIGDYKKNDDLSEWHNVLVKSVKELIPSAMIRCEIIKEIEENTEKSLYKKIRIKVKEETTKMELIQLVIDQAMEDGVINEEEHEMLNDSNKDENNSIKILSKIKRNSNKKEDDKGKNKSNNIKEEVEEKLEIDNIMRSFVEWAIGEKGENMGNFYEQMNELNESEINEWLELYKEEKGENKKIEIIKEEISKRTI